HFGDAMVVRHRLAAAVSRAARVCALAGPDALACTRPQVLVALGLAADRCVPAPLITQARERVGEIDVLRVGIECNYQSGFAGLVRQYADPTLALHAEAAMPMPTP
ncbi:MAG: hypothetical protein KC620_01290, partial [Myxococcales bacterium]|nr:hypothetical protein [Myxococcales bacterium]